MEAQRAAVTAASQANTNVTELEKAVQDNAAASERNSVDRLRAGMEDVLVEMTSGRLIPPGEVDRVRNQLASVFTEIARMASICQQQASGPPQPQQYVQAAVAPTAVPEQVAPQVPSVLQMLGATSPTAAGGPVTVPDTSPASPISPIGNGIGEESADGSSPLGMTDVEPHEE